MDGGSTVISLLLIICIQLMELKLSCIKQRNTQVYKVTRLKRFLEINL